LLIFFRIPDPRSKLVFKFFSSFYCKTWKSLHMKVVWFEKLFDFNILSFGVKPEFSNWVFYSLLITTSHSEFFLVLVNAL
jgi:hypothetical protein